jgi:hypothetical protein
MATQGTALVDFGAFPGGSDASLAVASATIGAGNLVEAWIFPAATADHTADEHLVETINIVAGNVVAGVGFTIYAVNTNHITEPVDYPPNANSIVSSTGGTAIAMKNAQPGKRAYGGGIGTTLYGKWSVGWVWN